MREYYDLLAGSSRGASRGRTGSRSGAPRAHPSRRSPFPHPQRAAALRHLGARCRRGCAAGGGIQSDVLYPPPPARDYRCDGYGDYLFAVSRLTPLKRFDLVLRALAEPTGRGHPRVIAGEGEERDRAARAAAPPRSRRSRRVRRPARRRAGCSITWRAAAPWCFRRSTRTTASSRSRRSRRGKPVVTCRDSGGPAELVARRRERPGHRRRRRRRWPRRCGG